MSWALGYDEKHSRDVGYGVPAYCDHPCCMAEINRGLSFVCGSEAYGGENGCGLYFCAKHLRFHSSPHRLSHLQLCERCFSEEEPFLPTADHPSWIMHKLTDESWKQWRDENQEDEVERMRNQR